MIPPAGRWLGPRWLTLCVVQGMLLAALAGDARASDSFAVRYRTADTVYLDAGRLAGLEEGDRLDVVRDGRVIGQIQVTFVADHSASCRLLREAVPIEEGDQVRLLGEVDQEALADAEPAEAAPRPVTEMPASPVPVRREPPQPATYPAKERSTIRSSGSLSFDWEQFTDGDDRAADYQRLSTRLNLRLRDTDGPWEFRLRFRRRDVSRDYSSGAGSSDSDTQDRLYEASFAWRPESGRFGLQLGRIGSSPFLGVGYLDGVIGQVRLTRGFEVGALVGTRPELNDLGFESDGLKYGVFTRFTAGSQSGRQPFELILGGIREEGLEDVSREYVTLQIRWNAGGRFSFYQSSEIDLNNGWRSELSDQSTQLSNLALSANFQLTEISRLSLSYDRFERYRTEETRSLPDELFDDLLRQGVHATLWVGRPRGLTFTARAGVRDQEGDREQTSSYGIGLRHNNVGDWNLSLSGDLLGFSNPFTEGYLARLRAAKRLGRSHEVSLDLGGRVSDPVNGGGDSVSSYWARLGFWAELKGGLFINGEVESTTGDEFEGQRLIIGLGYRL